MKEEDKEELAHVAFIISGLGEEWGKHFTYLKSKFDEENASKYAAVALVSFFTMATSEVRDEHFESFLELMHDMRKKMGGKSLPT